MCSNPKSSQTNGWKKRSLLSLTCKRWAEVRSKQETCPSPSDLGFPEPQPLTLSTFPSSHSIWSSQPDAFFLQKEKCFIRLKWRRKIVIGKEIWEGLTSKGSLLKAKNQDLAHLCYRDDLLVQPMPPDTIQEMNELTASSSSLFQHPGCLPGAHAPPYSCARESSSGRSCVVLRSAEGHISEHRAPARPVQSTARCCFIDCGCKVPHLSFHTPYKEQLG